MPELQKMPRVKIAAALKNRQRTVKFPGKESFQMHIAIVGAGASGLMAACRLADAGEVVTVFERNSDVGKKLAITGKGRCNLTNNADIPTVLSNIPQNGRFLYGALNNFPPRAVMDYFENALGLPLKTERGNRVFPQSDRAKDVVKVLENRLLSSGSRIVHEKVTGLEKQVDGGFLLFGNGRTHRADRVLLAAGGCSYPLTGSDGLGYKLARQMGHRIVAPKPSLVPLECRGTLCQALQGLSLKNVSVKVCRTGDGEKVYEDFGELLFTHFGLSGPVILSASAHMRDMAADRYEVHIDLKPALDAQTLDNRLKEDFKKYINRDFSNALSDLLPSKMIPVAVSLSGIEPHRKVNEIRKEERRRLGTLLKNLTFKVKGFRPIEEAIVTAGGVDVKEVNPRTMESKLVEGLFFAGEILDVDAYTGGFNLQIAFSTAALAAKAMVRP